MEEKKKSQRSKYPLAIVKYKVAYKITELKTCIISQEQYEKLKRVMKNSTHIELNGDMINVRNGIIGIEKHIEKNYFMVVGSKVYYDQKEFSEASTNGEITYLDGKWIESKNV